ncbi:amidohydrolase family protein [Staphylococcus sp. SQ8-PEA]|uniref:Amidohydrolase family protein n=1 Tax=Staphylococcus marylandisciuri TaxID=2981529 RepID=A0ABT2QN30_9STAP|nr:amidohydrolase family protein [Staphylococcus marylandisciuri]MCU5745386.1 amidohydrolase family protein [Staphylococcus marylandisciuri]
MKSITLEEHFIIDEIQEEILSHLEPDPNGVPAEATLEALSEKTGFDHDDSLNSKEKHEKRIQFMDQQDVQYQVLSYGSMPPSLLKGDKSIELCRKANDQLYDYIQQYPNRFLGFATLPINEPQAAAKELERCIKDLNFKGALIAGRTNNHFFDTPDFEIVFAAAEQLDVPIYLHPSIPPSEHYQAYYSSNTYDDATAGTFATFGFGWHMDVGIQAVRLVLSGLFDRHPHLKLIIGHWGEFVPFFLDRFDQALITKDLEKPVSQYFKEHFYITPSGMLTTPQFEMVKHYFSLEHILYSADYPYIQPETLGSFLEQLDIDSEAQEAISYKNARQLLKI